MMHAKEHDTDTQIMCHVTDTQIMCHVLVLRGSGKCDIKPHKYSEGKKRGGGGGRKKEEEDPVPLMEETCAVGNCGCPRGCLARRLIEGKSER